MRITPDKSGAPFGYCEGDCSGQMRVGGNAARIEKFYAKNPHIKRVGPLTATPEKIEIEPAAREIEPAKVSKPVPPKKLSMFDQLAGVKA